MHGLKQTRGSVFFFWTSQSQTPKNNWCLQSALQPSFSDQQEPWNSDNVRFGSNIRPDRSISFQSHLMLAHGLRQQSWPPRPTIWLVNLDRLHVLCRKPVETRCHRFQQEKNKPLRLQLFSRPLPQLLSKVLTLVISQLVEIWNPISSQFACKNCSTDFNRAGGRCTALST